MPPFLPQLDAAGPPVTSRDVSQATCGVAVYALKTGEAEVMGEPRHAHDCPPESAGRTPSARASSSAGFV